ncbi:sodium:calcium antiporter [Halobaculum magnesiiphilum]|uniref:Sodium:calcium antiporter n=1 Tax=Halobaculum magnesiiphilum TaxID=1017351 RepID=A0A8T8WA62_9EURY|nr:sodium:calcium antiporter [Halobaculum magnesiiphilum]QZP36727.1 sodium:calcium antiporter [Halobaculum magnesiiphilum]
MSSRLRSPLIALFGGLALTLPWIVSWATGRAAAFSTIGTVAVSGVAVLGASFLLAWGAETAEKDVPRAFAIAVLAVLAVAPEYAVDALYAWQAGQGDVQAANLAVANMTGANRILIGIGWSGIALFSIYQAYTRGDDPNVVTTDRAFGDYVSLDRDIALEIAFLFAATVYAFTVPLGGGIGGIDTLVLVGLYAAYILVVIRGDVEEIEDQVGVPAYLQSKPFPVRATAVLGLFGYSGLLIFTAVEPFAHGLEGLGLQYGIPEFFMIQWIAPLASESPELIVTAYLVNKARATAAFNALISSKLNQWTLLIGTLAVVYSISLGQYGVLMFDGKQAAEIWITAAQSFFALAILINFRISVGEALVLLVLFLSQVLIEFYFIRTMTEAAAEANSILLLQAYTVLYIVLTVGLLATRRDEIRDVASLTGTTIRDAVGRDAEQPAD